MWSPRRQRSCKLEPSSSYAIVDVSSLSLGVEKVLMLLDEQELAEEIASAVKRKGHDVVVKPVERPAAAVA